MELRFVLVVVFSTVLVGCGTSGPVTPSPLPTLHPPSQPNPTNSTVTILQVDLLPGQATDFDECDFGCPPNVVVRPDADGGYTLKASTEYTIVPTIGVDPAGCAPSYQVSFSWDLLPVQGDLCQHGDSYVEASWYVEFVTPPASNLGNLAAGQQVIVLVKTNSTTAARQIPIRFVP